MEELSPSLWENVLSATLESGVTEPDPSTGWTYEKRVHIFFKGTRKAKKGTIVWGGYIKRGYRECKCSTNAHERRVLEKGIKRVQAGYGGKGNKRESKA